jgi:hypothetical protein
MVRETRAEEENIGNANEAFIPTKFSFPKKIKKRKMVAGHN